MQQQTTKAAAIYARVSTDEQGKGYSLPTQVRECLKYAEEHGYKVIAEFQEDYTGASLDRPELDRLRELIATGAVDVVIVYDLDRLARKTVYQLLLEEEFQKAGVVVHYVIGQYEDSPEGQFQKQIRAAVAEYEREKFKERSTRGRRGRARAGFVIGSRTAPYGYRYVKGERQGWFEIEEEEARIVRMIYHWYVYGDESGQRLGTKAIARRLSEMRILTKEEHRKTKKQAGVWAKSTVGSILGDEVYTGVWYYNRRRQTSPTTRVERDRSEWIPVQVPAIIERELWEAARRQAAENRTNAPRNTKRQYLLQGRLTCAKCGLSFGAYTEKRYRQPAYYRCGGQSLDHAEDYQTKRCRRALRQKDVEPRVWDRIKAILQNPDEIIRTMQEKQAESDRELQMIRERLASIESRIKGLDAQSKKLLDLYTDEDSPFSRTMIDEKMAEIGQARARFEREAEELRDNIGKSAITPQDFEQVKLYCEKAQRGIETFTFEDKRNTLEALNVKGLVYRGETAEEDIIVLTGYLPESAVETYEVETRLSSG